jgi:hypothetical protein
MVLIKGVVNNMNKLKNILEWVLIFFGGYGIDYIAKTYSPENNELRYTLVAILLGWYMYWMYRRGKEDGSAFKIPSKRELNLVKNSELK